MKLMGSQFNTASQRDAKSFAPSCDCARNNGNIADFSDVAAAASVFFYAVISILVVGIILGLIVVGVVIPVIIISLAVIITYTKNKAKPIYVHSED